MCFKKVSKELIMLTLIRIRKIKLSLVIGHLIASICLMVTSNVYASSTDIPHAATLKVTPKPCVALYKGQKCYLEVTFSWQHPQLSNYCLVNTTRNKILKCWQQQATGEFEFDFQSTLTNDFSLRKHDSTVDLAQVTIPVAWVYKSSKRAKSTWRLF